MLQSETCRAARALIDWSQQRLADAANVGISTVKKFEGGHTTPTPNNLNALRNALEGAGVEFVSEELGGPGVLLRRLRLRAYIPGDGLHFEVKYEDSSLEGPGNNFDLAYKINVDALKLLAGRPITDERHAKAVMRANERKVIDAIKRRRPLSATGGMPRLVTVKDFSAVQRSQKNV